MPDAQYWNGYDRILDRANVKYASIVPAYGADSGNFSYMYEVLGLIMELLNRTSDYRDAAEASAAASVLLSGLSGNRNEPDDASGEDQMKPRYYPSERDLKKGYV